ncbi:MAG TPA: TPM domain-containing protein [Chitinophagaceae bacterium]
MRLFPWQKRREYFSLEEKEMVLQAIRVAEQQTSGEIRVYIEDHCRFVDPMDRAAEIFFGLKMDQTQERNGVLVYIAIRDRQLAILGDEGIHKIVGTEFWQKEVREMIDEFHADHYATGIAKVVTEIGEALKTHFPYDGKIDKNELPDDIVFGN